MSIQKVLVYLGATMPADASYAEAVRELGEGLVRQGRTLVFGGSREGTMTILADAVLKNGGKAIGVFTKALPPDLLYPGLTQTIITENILERKEEMFRQADAIIAMPGSFGTWDELFDALERLKIDKIHRRPLKPLAVLNLHGYYDSVLALLQRSVQEGYTQPHYAQLLHAASSVEELLEWLGTRE
jgi:hypothetical protein